MKKSYIIVLLIAVLFGGIQLVNAGGYCPFVPNFKSKVDLLDSRVKFNDPEFEPGNIIEYNAEFYDQNGTFSYGCGPRYGLVFYRTDQVIKLWLIKCGRCLTIMRDDSGKLAYRYGSIVVEDGRTRSYISPEISLEHSGLETQEDPIFGRGFRYQPSESYCGSKKVFLNVTNGNVYEPK